MSSGGRDRDKNRHYDSGAAKRKAREERAARESEVLSKVPKISELYFPMSSAACAGTGNIVDAVPDVQHQQHDEGVSSGESGMAATMEATEAGSALKLPYLMGTSMTLDDPSNSNSYSSDLGLWPVNVSDSMREYWAAKDHSQNFNS